MKQCDCQKVYLFKKKGGTTHASETKFRALGSFELDRMFGGGFSLLCGGKCEAGVISPVVMSPGWVKCKQCRAALKRMGLLTKHKPKDELWPPKHTRPLDQPRILGIPG